MSFFNFLYFTMTNRGLAQTVGESHTYNFDMHGMSVNYNFSVKCPKIATNPQICYHSRPNETISKEDLLKNLLSALRHLSDASDMKSSIGDGTKDANAKNEIKESTGKEDTGDVKPSLQIHSGVGDNSTEDKVKEIHLNDLDNSAKQDNVTEDLSRLKISIAENEEFEEPRVQTTYETIKVFIKRFQETKTLEEKNEFLKEIKDYLKELKMIKEKNENVENQSKNITDKLMLSTDLPDVTEPKESERGTETNIMVRKNEHAGDTATNETSFENAWASSKNWD